MNDTHPQNGAHDERAQRILEAAARLIIHYGFDKTTMSEIASEASVSKSTLYGYWKNKDELFDALILEHLLRYSEDWYALIDADPRGGTLIGMYTNVLYALQKYPLIQAFYKQDKRILGSYTQKQGDIVLSKATINKDFIRLMQDAGAVRADIDADVVAHIMLMLGYGLVGVHDVLPESDIPEQEKIIQTIGVMLDRALTPEDGGNSEAGKAIIRQILEVGKTTLKQMLSPQDPISTEGK